jgi:hypothetical protein
MEKNSKSKKGGKSDNKGNDKKDNKANDKSDKLKTCNFVKARHILCSKLSVIEQIYQTLTDAHGTTPPTSEFGKLAGEHSECPSKKKGGDLGYFGRGKMVGAFEQAAFSTQPGQMSSIVKTDHGYHIILVEDRKATLK